MGKFRKLGRDYSHRLSMLRTMVSQLVKHERIETTVAKAKEVRRKADQMVQLGKEGTEHAARRAASFVRGDDVVHKLFTELAYRYRFVDRENELREPKPATPPPPQRVPLDPWTKSRSSQQWAGPKITKTSESDSL
ncbi:uncharacterized protein LOC8085447 isoform X2 [Sorghum bicolor]|uniref:uncharacterized protein LOC8085447 isoform X2 n=1 Tax=Sorghum bicolor TaxID=4558 RepID=UPI000B42473D|nr:uncharacterized protein LOC8085447 isoform X2 [Sorghum bicolor]|eukprot:XP_021312777.1 uncharacterized protein LOC8085447 isoform X2 [Sorghum bicolor]